MSPDTLAPLDRSGRLLTLWPAAIWMICLAGCVVRFVHLDADPNFPSWIGYLTDEGRWNETARCLALFGRPDFYGISKLHLVLSPAYQATNYLVFEAAGLSFWTARLLSAATGSLLLVLTVLTLRRHVDALAMLVGIAFLAFSVLVANLSRLAIPEMPALLFMASAFYVLAIGRANLVNIVVAGVLVAGGAAMKGTTVLVAPAFVLVVALAPDDTRRVALRRVAGFVAGLVTPALIGLVIASAAGLLTQISLIGMFTQLAGFLRLGGAYDVLMRLVDNADWAPVLCLLLGLWYGSFLVASGIHRGDAVLCRLFLATGIWSAWALVVWVVQQYMPGRYLVHALYPLTLHAIVGATIWRRARIDSVPAPLRGTALPWVRALWTAWLVLPTAILLVPLAAHAAQAVGIDLEHLANRVLLIAAAGVVVWAAVWWVGPRPALVRRLLVFPVVMGTFWLVNSQFEKPLGFWFGASRAEQVLVGTAIICSLTLTGVRRLDWLAPVATVAIVVAGVFASPALYAPTYVVRDASRDLQRRFDGKFVSSDRASSFFLDNVLHYRDDLTVSGVAGGAVVLAHPHAYPSVNSRRYLSAEFAEEHGYEIPVSPGYLWEPGVGGFPRRYVRLEVFRRARTHPPDE